MPLHAGAVLQSRLDETAKLPSQMTPYMWRVVYSFAAGLSVGVATAIVLTAFAASWTWSSIHGGTRGPGSHVVFWVLTLSSIVAPPVLGFIAGRSTYRWIGRHNPDAQ